MRSSMHANFTLAIPGEPANSTSASFRSPSLSGYNLKALILLTPLQRIIPFYSLKLSFY